jgi:Lrp/AsnC family leucine-responsive transcriptional regulator
MQQLDFKDRKILYELDLNCRQSNAQIGKKVGLSKEVVKYRIKRMQDEEIIFVFWTEINTFKLGYHCFRIYINFFDVSSDIKNEIIRYFVDYKNSWVVLSVKGPVDFDVLVWVKDIFEFNQFWNNTLEKYGNYFEKHAISISTQITCQKLSFLLLDEYKKSDRDFYAVSSKGNPIPIDIIDYKLLNEISGNARISLVDLAEKLNCSAQTINYRLKNLIKKDVILAFRLEINRSKLGLQHCAIDVYLKDFSKRTQILEYVKSIPNVSDIMDMTIGWCDFNFEVNVESIDRLNQIMEDIERKFPGAIRKMNFWMSGTLYKKRSLPEMTELDFKKIEKSL